jgi:predicted dehydrogenase
MKFSIAIIGAGSIGAIKPDKYDCPSNPSKILTIAHAAYQHDHMDLVGIVETDEDRAKYAAEKWSTYCFPTFSLLTKHHKFVPDIVAVCTPTDTHFKVLSEIIPYRPRLIIAEKPFCSNYAEAVEIQKLAQEHNVTIMVDYIRRYDPIHRAVREAINCPASISEDCPQKVFNAALSYTRGFVHEACHAIDLFHWFFGDFITGNLFYMDIIHDRDIKDPTFAGILGFERCPNVLLRPVDGRAYAVFEIDVFTETGRITLAEHGLVCHLYNTVPDEYGKYECIPALPTKTIPTFLQRALLYLMDHAFYFLTKQSEPICTDADAIKVHELYETLLRRQ